MVRRSTPMSVTAERSFPVRVRVTVPPHGLGLRLNEMHEWLIQHAPDDGHFVGGERGPPQAALVYFADIAVARAFCHEFACGRMLLMGAARHAD